MNNQSTTPQRLEQFTLITTGGSIRFGRVEQIPASPPITDSIQLELDLKQATNDHH